MKKESTPRSALPHSGFLHDSLFPLLTNSEQEALRHVCQHKWSLSYPKLNLRACCEARAVLSPARQVLRGQEHHDERLGAWVQTDNSRHGFFPVTIIRAQLIGTLCSDSDGNLRISDTEFSIPLVVAPPPIPSMRGRKFYAANWHYIPGDKGRGCFEILLEDLIALSPKAMPLRMPASKRGRQCHNLPLSLRACVVAKSLIIGTRSKSPCFLVELKGSSSATIVVFRDSAIFWWPFIRVGYVTDILNLRLGSLPSCTRKKVLLASDSTVFLQELQSEVSRGTSTHSFSKSGSLSTLSKELQTSSRRSGTINYEGQVTAVLPDKRVILDDRIVFHPGSFYCVCPGPNAVLNLREGCRVKVFHTYFISAGGSFRLFPSARSSLDVHYFGQVSNLGFEEHSQSWKHGEWARLWNRWDRRYIFLAEIVYDALAKKFWRWFRNDSLTPTYGSAHERSVCFLGDRGKIGMVQCTMYALLEQRELVDGNEGAPPDLYNEFIFPEKWNINEETALNLNILSMNEFQQRIMESLIDKEWESISSTDRVFSRGWLPKSAILSWKEVSNICHQFTGRKSKHHLWQECFCLVGLLHGSQSKSFGLMISDETGYLPVRVLGVLDIAFVEAIILLREFYVVLNYESACSSPITIEFFASSAKVVVDGPYAEMGNARAASPSVCQTIPYASTGTSRFSNEAKAGIVSNLPSMYTHTASGQGISNCLFEGSMQFADVPLVCLFVEKVKASENGIELQGKLVAIRFNQKTDLWIPMLQRGATEEFRECKLILSGQIPAEMGLVIHEHRLWGVSCTELSGNNNMDEYIHRKCVLGTIPVTLCSEFSSMLPWVENLGNGDSMRFGQNLRQGKANCCLTSENLTESRDEGEVYCVVRDAIDRLLRSAAQEITKDFWSLYNGIDSSDDGQKRLVHLMGSIRENSFWKVKVSRNAGKEDDLCFLTIEEDALSVIAVKVNCQDRQDLLVGLAAGMRVTMFNVELSWSSLSLRPSLKAGSSTRLRATDVCKETGLRWCRCRVGSRQSITSLLCKLPMLRLLELNEMDIHTMRWFGMLRFDVIRVEEICVRASRAHLRGGCRTCVISKGGHKYMLDMLASVVVEDGTCQAVMRSEGFGLCCELLQLTVSEREHLVEVAISHGNLAISGHSDGQRYGLGRLFRDGSWPMTGVIECLGKTKSDEVVMKSFPLGFGRKLWTSCYQDCLVVKCLDVIQEDSRAWLKAQFSRAVVS